MDELTEIGTPLLWPILPTTVVVPARNSSTKHNLELVCKSWLKGEFNVEVIMA